MIDRDSLDQSIRFMETAAGLHPGGHIERVLEAARLVADPDTLTISKVDGEWPELRGLDDLEPVTWVRDQFHNITGEWRYIEDAELLDALLEGQPE